MKQYILAIFVLLSFFAGAQSPAVSWLNRNDPNPYYLTTNKDYYLPFYLTDAGTVFTNSVAYSYQVNNGPVIHQHDSVNHNRATNCVNALHLSKYRIALNQPVRFTATGSYTFKIWIDSLNGIATSHASFDTNLHYFKVLENLAPRKGLTEYFYHVSCGPCGLDGTPFYENLIDHFSDYTECVKLHNYIGQADWMKMNCPEAIEIDSVTGSVAHPEMTYNRIDLAPFQNADWYYPYPKFCPFDSNFIITDVVYNHKVPALLSAQNVQLNTTTGNLSFSLKAQFLDNQTFAKEVRLSCMLVEDSIYDFQANDNSNPIDSTWHRFVLRKIYGGPWGKAGSVPASVTAGQTVSLSFTDVLNSQWQKRQLYLIPLLQYYASSTNGLEILDVKRLRLMSLLPNEVAAVSDVSWLRLSPNPAQSMLHLSFDAANINWLEIYSIEGRLIKAIPATASINVEDLASGSYLLKASGSNTSAVVRFHITR